MGFAAAFCSLPLLLLPEAEAEDAERDRGFAGCVADAGAEADEETEAERGRLCCTLLFDPLDAAASSADCLAACVCDCESELKRPPRPFDGGAKEGSEAEREDKDWDKDEGSAPPTVPSAATTKRQEETMREE